MIHPSTPRGRIWYFRAERVYDNIFCGWRRMVGFMNCVENKTETDTYFFIIFKMAIQTHDRQYLDIYIYILMRVSKGTASVLCFFTRSGKETRWLQWRRPPTLPPTSLEHARTSGPADYWLHTWRVFIVIFRNIFFIFRKPNFAWTCFSSTLPWWAARAPRLVRSATNCSWAASLWSNTWKSITTIRPPWHRPSPCRVSTAPPYDSLP